MSHYFLSITYNEMLLRYDGAKCVCGMRSLRGNVCAY